MSSPPPIPILALSKHRDIVKAIGNVLTAHAFSIALRVLEPRPQALLIGGGYTDAEVADAQVVFHAYTEEVGIFKGTVVAVRQGVVRRDGVAMWVIGELKAHFERRTASEGFVDRVLAM